MEKENAGHRKCALPCLPGLTASEADGLGLSDCWLCLPDLKGALCAHQAVCFLTLWERTVRHTWPSGWHSDRFLPWREVCVGRCSQKGSWAVMPRHRGYRPGQHGDQEPRPGLDLCAGGPQAGPALGSTFGSMPWGLERTNMGLRRRPKSK